MSLSPYTTTLATGASGDQAATETYDIATRGRKGLILVSDVTAIGNGHSYVVGAAVTLPVVIDGTHKNFKFNAVEYTIGAGSYATTATLAAAINASLNVATRFDTVVTVTAEDATTLRFTNVASGVHAEVFAVGATNDVLATATGLTAAWTIAHTQAAGADGAYSDTVTIQGKDEASGKYFTLLTSAAKSTVTTQVLQVYPGITVAANLTASAPLPATIRVSIAHTTSNAVTRTIAAQLVN